MKKRSQTQTVHTYLIIFIYKYFLSRSFILQSDDELNINKIGKKCI